MVGFPKSGHIYVLTNYTCLSLQSVYGIQLHSQHEYTIPRVNNVWRRILLPLATSLRWIQKMYNVVNNPCEILCVLFLLFNWATKLNYHWNFTNYGSWCYLQLQLYMWPNMWKPNIMMHFLEIQIFSPMNSKSLKCCSVVISILYCE